MFIRRVSSLSRNLLLTFLAVAATLVLSASAYAEETEKVPTGEGSMTVTPNDKPETSGSGSNSTHDWVMSKTKEDADHSDSEPVTDEESDDQSIQCMDELSATTEADLNFIRDARNVLKNPYVYSVSLYANNGELIDSATAGEKTYRSPFQGVDARDVYSVEVTSTGGVKNHSASDRLEKSAESVRAAYSDYYECEDPDLVATF